MVEIWVPNFYAMLNIGQDLVMICFWEPVRKWSWFRGSRKQCQWMDCRDNMSWLRLAKLGRTDFNVFGFHWNLPVGSYYLLV